MDSLFGLSMNTIMLVLIVLLALSVSVSLLVFLRNRIIFMIGLRNIPRRVSQTVLIVIGLMLSTVIITAAFTTGDTVDYSITKQAYDLLGHADVILDGQVANQAAGADDQGHSVSAAQYDAFVKAADAAHFSDVDGYVGILFAPVPVVNPATNLSEPNVTFTGLDAARTEAFPDVIDKQSGAVLNVSGLGPNEVYLNSDAADKLNATAGQTLDVYVKGVKQQIIVKAIVKSNALTGAQNSQNTEGMVASLASVQQILGSNRLDYVIVSATGGVHNSLDDVKNVEAEVKSLTKTNNIQLEVSDTKATAVHDAERAGNFFATFFLVLGLFSIGAGVLLVVMIFVMLAAERKPEMGMARAVGTKRLHLIEMFLAEGTGYNLMSGIVGVFLGVLVAFAITEAASLLFSSFGLSFTPHATLRTLIISYSLGIVLTFLTVTFSSWRISNLNIVRAIRDIPEPTNRRMGWKGLAFWIFALAFGGLMVYVGLSAHLAFPFAFGFSLAGMGIAVLASHYGVPARPAYTTMGIFLLVFWGLAAGDRLTSIFGELDGGPEMFFLSGTAMVTASTFVIIYNSDIFLAFLSRTGGAFGSLLPAMRTAIAYPMANRFRTGMTLAMISLVVFALTMMSAMNLNYDRLFLADDSRGGWDVQVAENPNNPLPSVQQALTQAGSPVASEIAREGAIEIASLDVSATEVRQGSGDWNNYPVHGLTDGFLDAGSVPLDKIANGYNTQQDIWQALKTDPNVAVVDGFTIQSGGFGGDQLSVKGIPTDVSEKKYDAPTITVRDAVSGVSRDVRVIGVISFGASNNFMGVSLGDKAFQETFGPPVSSIHFLALTDSSHSDDAAKTIESTLVTTGVQADSLRTIAERNNALSRSFLYLMQAFMGLGLVVGIAAIGVIAFRTVVERRQQIGMLRAIGYKKSTVALSFLLESSFVTVLGVVSGMGLGLWLAYFLVTSSSFPAANATFHVPWLQLAFFATITLVASLAMTWIPARQAAGVPTAEALRYE
jgi:putative ABC transport system permease protein